MYNSTMIELMPTSMASALLCNPGEVSCTAPAHAQQPVSTHLHDVLLVVGILFPFLPTFGSTGMPAGLMIGISNENLPFPTRQKAIQA